MLSNEITIKNRESNRGIHSVVEPVKRITYETGTRYWAPKCIVAKIKLPTMYETAKL